MRLARTGSRRHRGRGKEAASRASRGGLARLGAIVVSLSAVLVGVVGISPAHAAGGTLRMGPGIIFPQVPIGGSNTSSFVISDESIDNLSVTIESVTLGGSNASDFAIVGDTCTGAILHAPFGQSSCQVDVRFTPTGAGPRNATLTIVSDALGSPHVATLDGEGVLAADLAASMVASPTRVLPRGQLDYLVTVTNLGQATAENASLLIGLPNPGHATFISVEPAAGCDPPDPIFLGNNVRCRFAIAPGESRIYRVSLMVMARPFTVLEASYQVNSEKLDPNGSNNFGNVFTSVIKPK